MTHTLPIADLVPLILAFEVPVVVVNHLIMVGIFIVLALSLNLINGYSGMFSLGHHGFWAVGAMASFWFLSMYYPSSSAESYLPVAIAQVPFETRLILFVGALAFATLMAMISGFIIGVPCLRLRGDYLAIATLGFGEIIFIISRYAIMNRMGQAAANVPELLVTYRPDTRNEFFLFFFAAVWLTVIAVAVMIHFLIKSSHGRAILAIREDEIPAELVGVNVTGYKILVFVAGAGMAGFIGAIYALFSRMADPQEFMFMQGVIILMMIVLGGQGSITGAIVGAIMIYAARELLKQDWTAITGFDLANLNQWWMVLFAVMLIFLMLNRPEGLMGRKELNETGPWRWIFRRRRPVPLATPTSTPALPITTPEPAPTPAPTPTPAPSVPSAPAPPAAVSAPPLTAARGTPTWAVVLAVMALATAAMALIGAAGLWLGDPGPGRSMLSARIIGALLLVQAVVGVLAGIGLFRKKHWGRIAAVAMFYVVGIAHFLAILFGNFTLGVPGLVFHFVGFAIGIRYSFPTTTAPTPAPPVPPAAAVVPAASSTEPAGDASASAAVAVVEPLLKISGVSKQFGGLKAVSDFNLELYPGELVGLIGPNGAGKTTCFNLITGVYTPTAGRIEFRHTAIHGRKPYEIVVRGVARTFQNIRLFKDLSVLENVRVAFNALTAPRYWQELSLAARSPMRWLWAPHRRVRELENDVAELDRRFREILSQRGMQDIRYGLPQSLFRTTKFRRAEALITERSHELLRIFNLHHRANDPAGSLPYGEQRRLEIARALATSPKLLILDEPAAGMNPQETDDLMHLIQWVRREFDLTVLLIEHDMKLVMGICERIVVLDHGETIAQGTPAEIRTDPNVIKAYLGQE